MYTPLPQASEDFGTLNWVEIEPWYKELLAMTLTQETLPSWLAQWSQLGSLVDETLTLLEIACTQNTADQERVQRKQRFVDDVYTHIQSYEQELKQQFLASGLHPEGFTVPLRNLRAEANIYQVANLPLLNAERDLSTEYLRIIGEQTVIWEGKETSVNSLVPVLLEPDRTQREQVWRCINERKLADREVLNDLWVKQIQLRQRIAQNAGYSNYRDYRWQQMHRFDYTPADCKDFHAAVEQTFVPAARQLRAKRCQLLGVETLRPWDLNVNPRLSEPPRLISDVQALLQQCQELFQLIDPQLGSYFASMLQKQLFDLDDRPSKAPGGYNLPLEVKQLPFVFGRVTSIEDCVYLIAHEAGHAFHVFEMQPIANLQQRRETSLPMEFAEVASTSMEFISAMHLQQAGLCTATEAVQLRIKHLESVILQLVPLVVRGDAFQHWVYEHPEQAIDAVQCDQKWVELSERFFPDIDWSGLDAVSRTSWQSILHFYCDPFYFIEYAFAALGALQIWNNYLHDPQRALQQYRYALSLGSTRTLPELFSAAGAKFAFDPITLQSALQLITQTLEELEASVI